MPGMFGGGGMSTQDIMSLAQQQSAMNRNNTWSPIYGGTTWTPPPGGDGGGGAGGGSFEGGLYNPHGSSGGGGGAGNGPWTQTQTLSPFMQDIFNSAQGLTGRLSKDMQPFDASGLPDLSMSPDFEAQQQQQAYNFAKGNMDPQWNQEEMQTKSALASQGLHPGDPAYERQMNLFNTRKQQAYNQASSGAYQTGVQAGATRMSTAAQSLQSQIQEQLAKSGWTAGQISQLMGMLPQGPSGQGPQVDMAGMALQNNLAQQQMQQQFWNNILGGGFMLGAGALARSDVEAKEDFADAAPAIEEFLESAEPAEYSYKPQFQAEDGAGRYVSPMAQGLEKSSIGRSLVIDTPTGKMVDYGKSFGALLGSLSHINKKLNQVMGL